MALQIIKGNFIDTPTPYNFKIQSSTYLIIEDGIITAHYETLPETYQGLPILDYKELLIIPGFVDLHVHAPQFEQVGLGLDHELINWLNQYTFKLESRFQDLDYAREVYGRFVDALALQGTTRACVFSTIHAKSTALLFDLFIEKGLGAYVGKVNMDQNGAIDLEETTSASLDKTIALIEKYKDHKRVKPILTPRFAPTCSEPLLRALGELANKYQLPVQSHLAENRSEVLWVQDLFPDYKNYGDVYNQNGLFGQTPTLMAHSIYLTDDEIKTIRENKVTLVHCPDSNMNLASGMMPVRRWLEQGLSIGLGSDVGGGHLLSMAQTIVRAVQTSKILQSQTGEKALSLSEAFYMATKGGGSFFGAVGSFEKGCVFDALVIKDTPWARQKLTLEERLMRWIYTGDDRQIIARYVEGALL